MLNEDRKMCVPPPPFSITMFANFYYFANLPLPQNFLERRDVATKERKK